MNRWVPITVPLNQAIHIPQGVMNTQGVWHRGGAAGEVREGLFDQNMAMIDRPWFYHFLTYDPRPMLRTLEQLDRVRRELVAERWALQALAQ